LGKPLRAVGNTETLCGQGKHEQFHITKWRRHVRALNAPNEKSNLQACVPPPRKSFQTADNVLSKSALASIFDWLFAVAVVGISFKNLIDPETSSGRQ
jgi:hypothetical protein